MGLEKGQYCKRQNRWMFIVDNILGDRQSINALPPSKAARPSLSFKEIEIKHAIEDVYIPGKPDWKPITVTVYDLKKRKHPIFSWIEEVYQPRYGIFKYPNNRPGPNVGFFRECRLELYDGCGKRIESWIFEDCWPQSIDFQTLDYSAAEIVMCDITLRYARAYIN